MEVVVVVGACGVEDAVDLVDEAERVVGNGSEEQQAAFCRRALFSPPGLRIPSKPELVEWN